MPKILLNVTEEQKALWVEEARREAVTLSEWIRRRCDTPAKKKPPPAQPLQVEPPATVASGYLFPGRRPYSGPDPKPEKKK